MMDSYTYQMLSNESSKYYNIIFKVLRKRNDIMWIKWDDKLWKKNYSIELYVWLIDGIVNAII